MRSGPMGLWPLQSKTGIKVMSFNLLLEYDDQPVIWRGPLIGRAITQLWGDVFWDELAYFACPDTGQRHEIFGPSHSHEVALAASAPLLAQLPLDPTVAALCDAGQAEAVVLSQAPDMVKAFVQAVPVTRPA